MKVFTCLNCPFHTLLESTAHTHADSKQHHLRIANVNPVKKKTVSKYRAERSGYVPCECRDCMEIAIASPGSSFSFCHECEAAGCTGDGECQSPHAYGNPRKKKALKNPRFQKGLKALQRELSGARLKMKSLQSAWSGPRSHYSVPLSIETTAREIDALEAAIKARGPKTRRNPAPPAAVRKAAAKYEEFHWGRSAKSARPVRVAAPKVLSELGQLEAVVYKTKKGKESGAYVHHFAENGGRRPKLAQDERGRLHVVGGSYKVKKEGIVG
jgi:hypothetical protein